ncbi:MAG: hypothetical protein M3069_13435 [Chloroflexota bacterium]|nr:hypothetical protein [Chloroflexota bacterium]
MLGVFLLLAVVYRRTRFGRAARIGLRGFAGLGAAARFGSALMGTVGPVVAPFFLSYGLLGAAYIGTEAVTALTMHAVKLVVYGGASVLTAVAIGQGLAIGLIMIAGTYLGKRILGRLPARLFRCWSKSCLGSAGCNCCLLARVSVAGARSSVPGRGAALEPYTWV